jgi:mycothiol S-conjugate amidase
MVPQVDRVFDMAGLTLLQVHAHPDDEASKGAGVAAKYADEGVRTILVTCTGGEAGELLNKSIPEPADLAATRRAELDESVRILGYSKLYLLGYRDSGMPDSPDNKDPRAFANADFDEAVGKLLDILRAERPQVVITYGEDHSGYPHPDHIRTHEITLAAFERAEEPWRPRKLYYCGWTRRNIEAMHRAYEANGLESPYGRWLENRDFDYDESFRAQIDVGPYMERRRAALLAHATQVAPDSFWMTLPLEEHRKAYPYEDYALARSLDGAPADESDLFAGLR